MNKKYFILGCTLVFFCFLLVIIIVIKVNERNRQAGIIVSGVTSQKQAKGYLLIGSKNEVEGGRKMIDSQDDVIDPAFSIVLDAERLYENGKYGEAEKEALEAIASAKHSIVTHSAHSTLLRIYEKTGRYEAAIKEIEWLLNVVNEQGRKDLLERRKDLVEKMQDKNK